MQTVIQAGGMGRLAAEQLGSSANLSKSQFRSGGQNNDRALQVRWSTPS